MAKRTSPLRESTAHPILIWANIRQDLWYKGLPDDLRGQFDAIRYGKGDLTEAEYTELYKAGSDAYRAAVDTTVRIINRLAD